MPSPKAVSKKDAAEQKAAAKYAQEEADRAAERHAINAKVKKHYDR